MGYYDFPHTRNYDTDLGYLIDLYNKLDDELKKLDLEKYINKRINEMVANGTFASAVSPAINDWLDKHPEATTVLDNSLTLEKLTQSTRRFLRNTLTYGNLLHIESNEFVTLPNTYYLQGSTKVGDYLYCYETDDNGNYVLYKVDLTGEIIDSDIRNMGHGNTVFNIGNTLFVHGNNKFYLYDITETNLTYLTSIDAPELAIACGFNNKMYVIGGGFLQEFSFENNTLTFIKETPIDLFKYGSGFQTMYGYKGKLYVINISSAYTSTVRAINLATLEVDYVIVIDNYKKHAEIESITIEDNYTYLFYAYDLNGLECVCRRIETPHLIQVTPDVYDNDFIINKRSINNTFLEIVIDGTNGNDITGHGSYQKPFKTINRALSRLRCRDITNTQIRLTFIGTFTDEIIIENINIQLYFDNSVFTNKITIRNCQLEIIGTFTLNSYIGLQLDRSNIDINGTVIGNGCSRIIQTNNSQVNINNINSVDCESMLTCYINSVCHLNSYTTNTTPRVSVIGGYLSYSNHDESIVYYLEKGGQFIMPNA